MSAKFSLGLLNNPISCFSLFSPLDRINKIFFIDDFRLSFGTQLISSHTNSKTSCLFRTLRFCLARSGPSPMSAIDSYNNIVHSPSCSPAIISFFLAEFPQFEQENFFFTSTLRYCTHAVQTWHTYVPLFRDTIISIRRFSVLPTGWFSFSDRV